MSDSRKICVVITHEGCPIPEPPRVIGYDSLGHLIEAMSQMGGSVKVLKDTGESSVRRPKGRPVEGPTVPFVYGSGYSGAVAVQGYLRRGGQVR